VHEKARSKGSLDGVTPRATGSRVFMIPHADKASLPVTVATGHAGLQSFGQNEHALVASARRSSAGSRVDIGQRS
jgi:hypothetical protein